MTEEKKITVGKPWTNIGTYNTYDEARIQLGHFMASQPTYDYKIKRTGIQGSKFTIKKRLNQKLYEAEQRLNKKMDTINNSKSKNKKKKK